VGTPRSSVTSTSRRRWTFWRALVTALVALPLMMGCGAGFSAQTNEIYQPAAGISDRTGQVYVINALVVGDGQGNGTVVTTLINETSQDDTFLSFTATDDKTSGVTTSPVPSSGIPLPAQTAVNLPDAATLQVAGDLIQPGKMVTLAFTFEQAAPVTIEVPVLQQSKIYAGIPVQPIGANITPTPASPSGS
jgi:copper(I)-binding protein